MIPVELEASALLPLLGLLTLKNQFPGTNHDWGKEFHSWACKGAFRGSIACREEALWANYMINNSTDGLGPNPECSPTLLANSLIGKSLSNSMPES
jgi:hypothetical protein